MHRVPGIRSHMVSQISYCINCHYQFIGEEKKFKQGIWDQTFYQLSLSIYWQGEVVQTGYLKSDIKLTVIINLLVISTVIIKLMVRRSSPHLV